SGASRCSHKPMNTKKTIMSEDEHARVTEGPKRALSVLLGRVEGRIDGDALLEHTRPAIVAVKTALRRKQRRVQAQSPGGSPFTTEPVRIRYRRGERMRSPNGLACAYVGRPTPYGSSLGPHPPHAPQECAAAAAALRAEQSAALSARTCHL